MTQTILSRILFLFAFLMLASSAILTPANPVLDVTSSGFILENGDIVAYEVVMTSENNSPGLTIELESDEGNAYNTSLDAGEEIAFQIESLPDWNANTSEVVLLGGGTNGGHFSLAYPAPYLASGIVDDNGPAYLMPVITIGDNTYWDDFSSVVSGNGFTVLSTETTFSMYQTSGSSFVNVSWSKTNGVMDHYRYEYQEEGVDKVLELIRADWDLITSQATTLGFSTTTPVLDYMVTEAEFGDLDDAFNFSAISIDENSNEGSLDAHGMFYVGDHVHASLDEYRFDDEMGYLLGLDAENGYIDFNITLELPNENPEKNDMFLYPQFIVTDTNILSGYLHAAEFVSDNYITSMTATHFSINFNHDNGSVAAEWEIDSGFLTSWKMNNTHEGQVLALELLAGEDAEGFDLNYDHVVSNEGHLYQFVQVNVEDGSSIPLDEDTSNPGVGYIGEGDFVYVNPTMASLTLDDTPPTVFYDINGTNGSQDNVSISFNYPGFDNVDPNGPPLLTFHHLAGNDAFFNWVETLYDSTGGDYTKNSTHIEMSYTNQEVVFQQVFRVADLVMVSYYYENSEFSTLLEINLVDDQVVSSDQPMDTLLETPEGLELPAYDIYSGVLLTVLFVALPIFRRRK